MTLRSQADVKFPAAETAVVIIDHPVETGASHAVQRSADRQGRHSYGSGNETAAIQAFVFIDETDDCGGNTYSSHN